MLQIFKAGTHRAMDGRELTFSVEQLEQIAAGYDPTSYEAPLVVGHPRTDAPAYGWVRGLRVVDGVLEAEPQQVDPQFAALVNEGRFKHLSVAFFAPNHPRNPRPGQYSLRHVGFLGATPPAVLGLRSAAFAGDDAGELIEFGDWMDRQQAGMWRRLREFFVAKFGMETADEVIPSWQVDQLQEEALRPDAAAEPAPAYAASPDATPPPPPPAPPQPTPPAAEPDGDALAAREQALAEREQALAARETAQREEQARQAVRRRLDEMAAFAAELVQRGVLLPADSPGLVAFAASLDDAQTVQFAGGEAPSALAWFKDWCGRLPVQVHYGELSAPEADGATAAFAVPSGYSVVGAARAHRIRAHMAAHQVDFHTALAAVGEEG
jgi:hypothetical protein